MASRKKTAAPFELGELNADTPHLLADLIELIAILSLDGKAKYSPADIESILVAEKDSLTRRVGDVVAEAWKQLSYRAGRFDRAYPFTISGGQFARRRDTPESRVYIFLVACSRLRSFNSQLRQKWATSFANLGAKAVKGLSPSWAETRIFDANSDDRRDYYGTDLRIALKKLASDMAAKSIDEEEVGKQSASGDYGIDIASYARFDDGAHTNHALLGQCAARGESWPDKRLEAHSISLSGVFTFSHPPTNVMLTPVLFRQTNGAWVDNTCTSGCIVIDRWRIIFLLRKLRAMQSIVRDAWFAAFEKEIADVAAKMPPLAA